MLLRVPYQRCAERNRFSGGHQEEAEKPGQIRAGL
jgi:hypothetical protein